MQGQYPGNRGGRPCGDRGFDHAYAAPARLFLCAGCHAQALICSCCDRGQIYCAGDCADRARRRSLQCAGQRYQDGPPGRRRHAARQGRYRARDKKVTHHGSPPPPRDDLLTPGSPVSASDADVPEARPGERSRTVIGVVVGARHSSARVPASPRSSPRPAVARPDRMEPEHGDTA